LTPKPESSAARAVVVAREFKGHDLTYRIAVGERELVTQTMTQQDLAPGTAVGVEVEGDVLPLADAPAAAPGADGAGAEA
jgi:iron(III) transport system ATP-binding protein